MCAPPRWPPWLPYVKSVSHIVTPRVSTQHILLAVEADRIHAPMQLSGDSQCVCTCAVGLLDQDRPCQLPLESVCLPLLPVAPFPRQGGLPLRPRVRPVSAKRKEDGVDQRRLPDWHAWRAGSMHCKAWRGSYVQPVPCPVSSCAPVSLQTVWLAL